MARPAALLQWLLTVSLPGYGLKKAYDGYQDKSLADEIVEEVKTDYRQAKERLDSANKTTEAEMERLGNLQLQIEQEFKEFEKLVEVLLQKLKKSSDRKDLQLSIPQHKLDRIKKFKKPTTFLLHSIVGGFFWAYAKHAEQALEDARKTRKKVREAVKKIDVAIEQLNKIREYAEKIYSKTSSIHNVFMEYFGYLKEVSQKLSQGEKISSDCIIEKIDNGYMLAAILTDIITTPLFKVKKDKDGNVLLGKDNAMEFEEDSQGNKIINTEGIELALQNAGAEMKKVPAICA